MKSISILIFSIISIFIFGQNDELYLWRKHDSYKYLDTINTYSKKYPTKLIEGSGTIKSKKKKIIGPISFETEITKNLEDSLLRIYDSQNYFYKKRGKVPAKTINFLTYIYFNNLGKADFAKVTREEVIDERTITSSTEFYDLQKINFDLKNLNFNEIRIRELIKDYLK